MFCLKTAVRLKPERLIPPPRSTPGEVSRAAFVGRVWLRMLKCPCPPSSAGLELSVNNHAADFTLSAELGPPISLSCLVHNSSQAEELLWYRGDGQVDLKDGNKLNISNICISPVNESDNGVTFTCRLARDTSVQVSVTLDVQCESPCWIPVWDGWAAMGPWVVFCTLVRCLHREKMCLGGDNSREETLPIVLLMA